jgi:hypothetical protein
MPTSLDNGRRSPRKLLRAVVARLLGRKAWAGTLAEGRRRRSGIAEKLVPVDEERERPSARFCSPWWRRSASPCSRMGSLRGR